MSESCNGIIEIKVLAEFVGKQSKQIDRSSTEMRIVEIKFSEER